MRVWGMTIAGAAAMALAAPGQAAASGNRYSFSRAAEARVDYRATPHRAARGCADVAPGALARLVAAAGDVPEHCRIDGVLPMGIGYQLNLPSAWNGRLYMHGNGGYAGEDPDSAREQASRDAALRNGFAVAQTDTGHRATQEPLAIFARDEVKLRNHGYGAVHATVVFAKQTAQAYYGMTPRHAYWDGCSTGGRQGVMSAQRFPGDFDGIVAAAPTLDWSSIMIKGAWNRAALAPTGLTAQRLAPVFASVLAKCDEIDGLKDGLIADPRLCDFRPERDLQPCDGDGCLSAAEIAALDKVYAGPPKGAGTPAWLVQSPGFEHASALFPFVIMPGGRDMLTVFSESWMRHIGLKDDAFELDRFDFARDPARIREADPVFNPTADLAAFRARGGKMITFWGWADTALNPQMGLDYYHRLAAQSGVAGVQDFYRFFLVPGVAHCAGGYGPDEIDALSLVIDWVEAGVAPARLPARRHGRDGLPPLNRAYCPYPAETRYRGAGDPEDPSNFDCKPAPERRS